MSTEDMLALHLSGMSFGEIAKKAGLTRNIALGRVTRALQQRARIVPMAPRGPASWTDPDRADRLLRRFSREADQ